MTPALVVLLVLLDGTGRAEKSIAVQRVETVEVCKDLGEQWVATNRAWRRYNCLVSGGAR